MRQVGKIKEYNEADPVEGFLNRVRAELQRPTDTNFEVVWCPAKSQTRRCCKLQTI